MQNDFLGLFEKDTDAVALKAGETLFEKGEPGNCFYVVRSGEIDLLDSNHIHETVTAGGLFGEMVLVDRGPRSAGARARSDAVVIPVDERRFLFMVQQTPYFALRVMELMSYRLRRETERAKGAA